MTTPRPRPGILDIAPYVGGESKIAGINRIIKLSSNESAIGPSPMAIAAHQAAAPDMFRYPDGDSKLLREAIGRHHDLDPARIVCGAGSDELLHLLVECYAMPGDEVLYNRHGFAIYPIAAMTAGAVPVAAPEVNYTASVDTLLERISSRTRLVMLANPNNPTGTYLPTAELKRLRDGMPADALLVIDSAYAEFVDRPDYTAGEDLVDAHDNVVMTRTFSKLYGLAGLRVGWAYGPPAIVDVLNRTRPPFNVNLPAQAAAVAALDDTAHTQKARDHNARWLPWLVEALTKLGLPPVPSVANFVLVPLGSPQRAKAAQDFLRTRGILVRQMGGYHLPDFLRVSVGLEDELKAFIEALGDFLKQAR
jgi:histidinol-phosphate aminotransferase